MNAIKISTLILGLALTSAIGCGSDNTSGGTGGAVIIGGTGGAGGSALADASSGAGGATGQDASGTGDSMTVDGGKLDAGMADVATDAPLDSGPSTVDSAGSESGSSTNICTGLTAAACDLAIRNADTTSFAQDVAVTTPPPDYLTCVAQ